MAEVEDAAALRSRIAQLEEELVAARQQADAAIINAESACQAMDQRYSALAEVHGRFASENSRLTDENANLQQELGRTKAEIHKLKSVVVERDALVERTAVEINSVRADNRSLDKLLQQKQLDLEEVANRLDGYMERVVSLTSAKTVLEAKLQEAEIERSNQHAASLRQEQEKQSLQSHSKWLDDELQRTREAHRLQCSELNKQIVQLQQQLDTSQTHVSQLEMTCHQAKADVERYKRSDAEKADELRKLKEEHARANASFKAEQSAQANVINHQNEELKRLKEERAKWEGMARELKLLLEEKDNAHNEALTKAEKARDAALKVAEEEKQRRLRITHASVPSPSPSGLPSSIGQDFAGTPGPSGGLRGVPDGPVSTPAASPEQVASMSRTQMFSELVEWKAKARQEHAKRREAEVVLEQLFTSIEEKAVVLAEQQREYETLKSTNAQFSAQFQVFNSERRGREARIAQLEAELRRNERECRSLQQQYQDVNHQLAAALDELQRLQHGSANGSQRQAVVVQQLQLQTAQDVISAQLRDFRDIEELLEQNHRLLRVSRDLSRENEQTKAEALADMQRDYDAKLVTLRAELDASAQDRERLQVIIEQLLRQRDMYKRLYTDRQAPDASAMASVRGLPAPQVNGTPSASAQDIDFKAVIADKDKELDMVRQHAGEVTQQLRSELERAQEKFRNADVLASTNGAEAAFHKDRADRLDSDYSMLQRQMQEMAQSRAKLESMLSDALSQYNEASGKLAQAQQDANLQRNRAQEGESQRELLTAQHRQLTEEVQQLRIEKMKLSSEVQLAAQLHQERMQALKQEKEGAEKRLQEAEGAKLALEKELSQAQRKLEAALSTASAATAAVTDKMDQLRDENKKLQERASAAEQRAASAEAKVDLLQKAVNTAEQRAATLEMQKTGRPRTASAATHSGDVEEGSAATVTTHELTAELELLRAELADAQEAAAAATANSKTFQALATSSDEALRTMQDEHDRFKVEAHKRLEAESAQVQEYQEQVTALETQCTDFRSQVNQLQAERDELTEKYTKQAADLRSQIAAKERQRATVEEQQRLTLQELDRTRQLLSEQRNKYENSVAELGDAVRQRRTLEERLRSVADNYNVQQQRLADLDSEMHTLRMDADRERMLLQSEVGDLTSQVTNLKTRNERLSISLENTIKEMQEMQSAAAAPGGSGAAAKSLEVPSQLDELLQHQQQLRMDNKLLELQLAALQQEITRTRLERDAAARGQADAAQKLQEALEKSRTLESVAAQEKRLESEDLMATAASSLRAQLKMVQEQLQAQRTANMQQGREMSQMRQELIRLRAQNENSGRHAQTLEAEIEQWRTKALQMVDRSSTVSKSEHEAVQKQLEAAAQEAERLKKHSSMMQTQLNTQRALAESRLQEITQVKEQLASALAEAEQLRLRADGATQDGARSTTVVRQLREQLQTQKTALTTATENLERNKRNLQSLLKTCKEALELPPGNMNITTIKTGILALKKKLEKAADAQEKLNAVNAQYQTLQEQHAKLEAQHKALQEHFAALKASAAQPPVQLQATPAAQAPSAAPAPSDGQVMRSEPPAQATSAPQQPPPPALATAQQVALPQAHAPLAAPSQVPAVPSEQPAVASTQHAAPSEHPPVPAMQTAAPGAQVAATAAVPVDGVAGTKRKAEQQAIAESGATTVAAHGPVADAPQATVTQVVSAPQPAVVPVLEAGDNEPDRKRSRLEAPADGMKDGETVIADQSTATIAAEQRAADTTERGGVAVVSVAGERASDVAGLGAPVTVASDAPPPAAIVESAAAAVEGGQFRKAAETPVVHAAAAPPIAPQSPLRDIPQDVHVSHDGDDLGDGDMEEGEEEGEAPGEDIADMEGAEEGAQEEGEGAQEAEPMGIDGGDSHVAEQQEPMDAEEGGKGPEGDAGQRAHQPANTPAQQTLAAARQDSAAAVDTAAATVVEGHQKGEGGVDVGPPAGTGTEVPPGSARLDEAAETQGDSGADKRGDGEEGDTDPEGDHKDGEQREGGRRPKREKIKWAPKPGGRGRGAAGRGPVSGSAPP